MFVLILIPALAYTPSCNNANPTLSGYYRLENITNNHPKDNEIFRIMSKLTCRGPSVRLIGIDYEKRDIYSYVFRKAQTFEGYAIYRYFGNESRIKLQYPQHSCDFVINKSKFDLKLSKFRTVFDTNIKHFEVEIVLSKGNNYHMLNVIHHLLSQMDASLFLHMVKKIMDSYFHVRMTIIRWSAHSKFIMKMNQPIKLDSYSILIAQCVIFKKSQQFFFHFL